MSSPVLGNLSEYSNVHNLLLGFWQVAKRFVETALDYSKDIVIGNGAQGPFDHFFALKSINQSTCGQNKFNPNDLLLYAVTDSGMNRRWGRSISDAVKSAVEGGATIVQLRFVGYYVYLFCHVIWKTMLLSICNL